MIQELLNTKANHHNTEDCIELMVELDLLQQQAIDVVSHYTKLYDIAVNKKYKEILDNKEYKGYPAAVLKEYARTGCEEEHANLVGAENNYKHLRSKIEMLRTIISYNKNNNAKI